MITRLRKIVFPLFALALLALPAACNRSPATDGSALRAELERWRSDGQYAVLLEELAIWRTPVAEADTGYTIGPTACHRQHGFRPVDHAGAPFGANGDTMCQGTGCTSGGANWHEYRRRYGFDAPGLDPLLAGSEPCLNCCEDHPKNRIAVEAWCRQRKATDPSWPHDCRATLQETYDWSFGHQATAAPGGTDPGCMTGWRACPPPREADRYAPQPAPCWREISGGRLTAAEDPLCHVAPPTPQPPAPPEPEPGPPAPEPGEPGERAICESVLDVAVALGCGSLNPLPPCDGCWQCRCLSAAVCQGGVTP